MGQAYPDSFWNQPLGIPKDTHRTTQKKKKKGTPVEFKVQYDLEKPNA